MISTNQKKGVEILANYYTHILVLVQNFFCLCIICNITSKKHIKYVFAFQCRIKSNKIYVKLCKFVCELLHGIHKLVFVLLRGLGPCQRQVLRHCYSVLDGYIEIDSYIEIDGYIEIDRYILYRDIELNR